MSRGLRSIRVIKRKEHKQRKNKQRRDMLLTPHFLADFVPNSLIVKYYVVRAVNISGVALTLRSPKART